MRGKEKKREEAGGQNKESAEGKQRIRGAPLFCGCIPPIHI
jgi:hypothetical protein